jgi:hypothetical protein
MVTHRWWGNKFCKRTCKDARLRALGLDRDTIRRWLGSPARHQIIMCAAYFDSRDAQFLRNILCARQALEFSHGQDPSRK